eukprot:TRINITY_DN776167_c0_g1_i1.p1 TRINITY_DN776167_c0_g1~~TRINITY_DN776167_c0_g1_i1.p1  ORF type:complete len:155 (-),score=27.54 TRINITY_DN776167_c0_g1_i1:219-683(-)
MDREVVFKTFDELSGAEVYEILLKRYEVFNKEQGAIYQDIDSKDEHCTHGIIHSDDGSIAAYIRIIPKEFGHGGHVSFGRFLVTKTERRKGLARRLFSAAIKFVETEWNKEKIVISAQAYLKDFYATLGFVLISDDYLEANLLHARMELDFEKQ